jgi:flagellar biosynthesis component FlhA
MQSEAIKYQPPAEGVVVTQEEEQQILKLGRILREQLDQSHEDVRLFGKLSTVMAFLLGMESAVLFLMAAGIIAP